MPSVKTKLPNTELVQNHQILISVTKLDTKDHYHPLMSTPLRLTQTKDFQHWHLASHNRQTKTKKVRKPTVMYTKHNFVSCQGSHIHY